LDLGVMPFDQFASMLKEDVALRRSSGSSAQQSA
jgi:hypothetical protein